MSAEALESSAKAKAFASIENLKATSVVEKKKNDVVAKALAKIKDKKFRKRHPLAGNLYPESLA